MKLATIAFLLFLSCQSPTEPKAGCEGSENFCNGLLVSPLSKEETIAWQEKANDYVDSHYGAGGHYYPSVEWHSCFFTVQGICCAGYTESKSKIHVSTAEPHRTGALVAHETLHVIYWNRFGDPDASHSKRYAW